MHANYMRIYTEQNDVNILTRKHRNCRQREKQNQTKTVYLDGTQLASLKVNLNDFVKKASKKIRLTVLSQFLINIEGLEKFGL